jgi:translation elongation factor EF-1beta
MKYIKGIKIISSLLFCIVISAQDIKINDIKNSIQTGPLVGNRNVGFGLKNILEEVVQDQDYNLNDKSKNILNVELIYFDVKRTQSNIALYSKSSSQTEIIAIAKYKKKKVKVKGTAKDITTSLILLNEQGKFTQNSVSVALKKLSENIIKKLKL